MADNLHGGEKEAQRFYNIVATDFSFLTEEYGFNLGRLREVDFDSSRDAHVFVPFIKVRYGIKVVLAFADCYMGVGIVELVEGNIPDKSAFRYVKGYGRGLDLDFIVQQRSPEKLPDLLPPLPTNPTMRKIKSCLDVRRKKLEQDMNLVAAGLASRLSSFAGDLLCEKQEVFEELFQKQSAKFAEKH